MSRNTARAPQKRTTLVFAVALSFLCCALQASAISLWRSDQRTSDTLVRDHQDIDASEAVRVSGSAGDATTPANGNLDYPSNEDDEFEPDLSAFGIADASNSTILQRRAVGLSYPPRTNRNPSNNWVAQLGPYKLAPNIVDRQWSNFYHLPVIPASTGGWIQFWSESTNHRTVSRSGPFFENVQQLQPQNKIFGGAYNGKGFANGGKWLMSVIRHPTKGGANLIGFYHAQDHWNAPLYGGAPAWKTIGVAYSSNDGRTWVDGGLIITSHIPRPATPQFGGVGDMGVVWDFKNKRFICFYGGDHWLGMAISTNVNAKPGTWRKWGGPRKGFTVPALGGKGFPVGYGQLADGSQNWNVVRGLALKPGSNPGIHFNVILNKWVMIWNSWEGELWISANADLMKIDGWERPRLLTKSIDGTRAWHPTVVCNGGGSSWCNAKTGRLYYADRWRKNSDVRDFVSRTITFVRRD